MFIDLLPYNILGPCIKWHHFHSHLTSFCICHAGITDWSILQCLVLVWSPVA